MERAKFLLLNYFKRHLSVVCIKNFILYPCQFTHDFNFLFILYVILLKNVIYSICLKPSDISTWWYKWELRYFTLLILHLTLLIFLNDEPGESKSINFMLIRYDKLWIINNTPVLSVSKWFILHIWKYVLKIKKI